MIRYCVESNKYWDRGTFTLNPIAHEILDPHVYHRVARYALRKSPPVNIALPTSRTGQSPFHRNHCWRELKYLILCGQLLPVLNCCHVSAAAAAACFRRHHTNPTPISSQLTFSDVVLRGTNPEPHVSFKGGKLHDT